MLFADRALQHCHNIADLRELARRRLPSPLLEFIDGGADDELTARRNTSAFEDYELVPRVLVDVSRIDSATRLLGQRIGFPVILAPTGGTRLFHRAGEPAVARASARAGTIYSLATFSTTSLEEVAQASSGPKMFQLYAFQDMDLNKELLERCADAGYVALCLTVDCPVAGNRERDLRTGLARRPRRLSPRALLSVLSKPAWACRYLTDSSTTAPANFRGLAARAAAQLNPCFTWEAAAALMRDWDGPFAIKGILSPEDAQRAADIGATAVIVSNHGGRQLDGAIPALHALPGIVEAVGDRIEVILDGGVRRGTHVLMALALGAKACMIGRPYLYGLAAAGEAGVDKALQILRDEIVRGTALLGCTSIDAITADRVTQVQRR